MKKIAFILSCIVLMASCEKIDSHYTYEETVPGTTVKESQLGKKISLQEFYNTTQGVLYQYSHAYPCIEEGGKVYYSTVPNDEPVLDGDIAHAYLEFKREYLKLYVCAYPGSTALYLTDYTYDEKSQLLDDVRHLNITDNIENKLIYLDRDYMIFETKGIAEHYRYCSDDAEFSRVVYKRFDKDLGEVDFVQDRRDIYATFPTVPDTEVSEEAISVFSPITHEQFLTITKDKVYHLQGEYLCLELDGVVKYIPNYLPLDQRNDYNLLNDIIGGTIDYYTFHDDYTSRYYYGIGADGEELAGLDKANYTFDEASQLLDCQRINANIVYADEESIVLEAPMSEFSIRSLQYLDIPMDYYPEECRFFDRTVLIRHTGELKEPTTVHDYRN